jgi:antibiotic biosynthesis monooxygenase (ABM) superfamily enzyme
MVFSLLLSFIIEFIIVIITLIVAVILYSLMYYIVFPKVKFLKFLFEEPKDKKRNKPKNRQWKR